jgi:cell division protein FtsB
MKQQSKRYQSFTKVFTVALLLFALTPMFAQGGATAISNAASDIKDYWDPIKLI